MKKLYVLSTLLLILFALNNPVTKAEELRRGEHGGGHQGGWPREGNRDGGNFGSGWHDHHGSDDRWHEHGHHHAGGNVGFYFGSPYYSPYYAPPIYYPPAVVEVPVPVSPPVYIQQTPQPTQNLSPGYWYYCQNPQGYYPYVRECPSGWQQVPPIPPPGQ